MFWGVVYWVGGSGNWSEHGSHWATTSGGAVFYGQVPTSMDDVHFDANSFPAGGTVTVDETIIYCRNMDWTGVTNTPIFSGTSSKGLHIYGSLTLDPGMTLSFNGQIHFLSVQTGNTLKSAGKVFLNDVFFEGIGGGWTLLDNFTSNDRINQSTGTFSTDSKTVSVTSFSSGGDALYLGSSNFYVTQTNFNIGGSTLLDAGTSHVYISAGNLSGGSFHTFYNVTLSGFGIVSYVSISQKLTFQGNNSTYEGGAGSTINEVEFQQRGIIEGSGTYFTTAIFLGNGDLNGDNSFMGLHLAPGFQYRFRHGKTTTIVPGGTLDASGSSCSNYITIISLSSGNQSFINTSGANLAVQFVTLMDMAVTGGGSIAAANSIDLGNNTGWNVTPPPSRTLYWVGGGGNWNDVLHWSLSSGGANGACIPSAFDDVFFDQNSGFASAGEAVSVNIETAYCRDMTWMNVANTPEFKVSSSSNKLYVYGSLALDAGMTLNFNGEIRFRSKLPGETIFSAGKTFIKSVYLEGIGGEWTLLDGFTSSNQLRHQAGVLYTGGNTVSVSGLTSGGTSLHLGSSNVYVTQTNFSIGGSTVNEVEFQQNGNINIYVSSGTAHLERCHLVKLGTST